MTTITHVQSNTIVKTPLKVGRDRERFRKQSNASSRKLATAIRQKINEDRQVMRDRLKNWGRWYRQNNIAEIDAITGQIRVSFAGRIMEFAPHVEKSGYTQDPPTPIDDDDAMPVDSGILTIPASQRGLLKAHYVHHMEHGEIAKALKCTRQTVINYLNSAIDTLSMSISSFDT